MANLMCLRKKLKDAMPLTAHAGYVGRSYLNEQLASVSYYCTKLCSASIKYIHNILLICITLSFN